MSTQFIFQIHARSSCEVTSRQPTYFSSIHLRTRFLLSRVRARHRTIASIVRERCSSHGEKEEILTLALGNLNLNYLLDKNAFENFIRDDRSIDQINSFEGKTRFFETASKKDPESPYVKQHYSRMLLREKKHNIALDQIENAIKLSPRNRVLYHTKGKILMELAVSSDTPEIARKWLSQSETSFRYCLKLYEKDAYSYQGLAQLYFGWAKAAHTEEEYANYLTKAEEVIAESLLTVRSRESLWIESARIEEYLGDEPARIISLERAVVESPGSIVARYILGRAYRKSGEMKKCVDVLEPTIKDHSDEYRSFVEYALAKAVINQSYKESISVLQLSRLYGFSDPRFIAVLGGMLTMDGALSKAENIFEQTLRQNFSSSEMQSIQFRPWELDSYPNPVRLNGTVVKVKAGYALIEVPGYKTFLCLGSKFNGIIMEEKLNLIFSPAFSARGRLALDPVRESDGT